jgi:hypothetical protein
MLLTGNPTLQCQIRTLCRESPFTCPPKEVKAATQNTPQPTRINIAAPAAWLSNVILPGLAVLNIQLESRSCVYIVVSIHFDGKVAAS